MPNRAMLATPDSGTPLDPNADPNHLLQQQQQASMVPSAAPAPFVNPLTPSGPTAPPAPFVDPVPLSTPLAPATPTTSDATTRNARIATPDLPTAGTNGYDIPSDNGGGGKNADAPPMALSPSEPLSVGDPHFLDTNAASTRPTAPPAPDVPVVTPLTPSDNGGGGTPGPAGTGAPTTPAAPPPAPLPPPPPAPDTTPPVTPAPPPDVTPPVLTPTDRVDPATLTANDAGGAGPSNTTPLTAADPLPSAALTPVDGTNNLLGSQINPAADPRLAALKTQLDAAAAQLSTANRVQTAKDTFNTFRDSTDPEYQAEIRDAEQAAAGAGQLGSGQFRGRLGDVATTRTQQLANEEQSLIQAAENGTIQDKLNNVGALSGLEGQQFGEQTTNNNQLDQQQGFQNEQEQEAEQAAERQYELEQEAQGQQFNQGLQLSEFGAGGNPSAAYAQLAGQLGMDPSVIQALAAQLGAKSVSGGSGAAPGGVDVSALLASLLGGQQAGGALPGVSTIPGSPPAPARVPPITGGPTVAPIP